MTSAQAELDSARPSDELHNPLCTPDIDLNGVSSLASTSEVMERLNGHFSADVAHILHTSSQPFNSKPTSTPQKSIRNDDENYGHKQYILACLRAKNVDGAINFVQRHIPELTKWLNVQIKRYAPRFVMRIQQTGIIAKAQASIDDVTVVPDGILIDAEAGRIARILGQFGVFRSWAYAHSIDDGDGWIERKELELVWCNLSIASSKCHARRIIQQGIQWGYWTQDKTTKRIYLTGQVKIAKQLVKQAIDADYHHLIETNKPGKRRVQINLSGSLQDASANLYTAWLKSKDPHHKGTTISRDMLCDLWQVSVPTLLKWEAISGISKQANFAQSNNTNVNEVPSHAYLTLNRDGTYASSWRLPNTYLVNDKAIQQHQRTGKATKIRKTVQIEIDQAEQRGAIGDAALPRSGKFYFSEDCSHKVAPFRACSNYLRKLSRKNGDVFKRRYVYVGKRHGVRIFEPYDLTTNAQQTTIHQRLIWQEKHDEFKDIRDEHRRLLQDHHQYLELFT